MLLVVVLLLIRDRRVSKAPPAAELESAVEYVWVGLELDKYGRLAKEGTGYCLATVLDCW